MAKKALEEGQLVLCTVTKIVGTVVFVRVEDYNLEGTITFSEIAPGRIRNIREYAFPGKKIVCKILSIKPTHTELSFRRVKVNERNEFNDNYKREKSCQAMLRTMLKEKAEEVITNIKENEGSFLEFIESSKENPKVLEKYLSKEDALKISSILKEKKVKETTISRKFTLSSKAKNGMTLVKTMIKNSSSDLNNIEISYIAAGKYLAKIKGKDLKQADNQLKKMLESLEQSAKKNSCQFSEIKG